MPRPPSPPDPFDPERDAGRGAAVALAKIAMALRHRSWREGFARELTPTQGQVLLHLSRHPGSTLKATAAALGVRPSTASEAVATLEEKGLLRRARRASDRRRLAIRLTAEGRREAERAAGWPDFLAEVADELPADEQAALLRALQRMICRLQERGEVPVARICSSCTYFRPRVHDDPERPHHCAFVDVPFGDRALRFDCPDHETAPPAEQADLWRRFTAAVPGRG